MSSGCSISSTRQPPGARQRATAAKQASASSLLNKWLSVPHSMNAKSTPTPPCGPPAPSPDACLRQPTTSLVQIDRDLQPLPQADFHFLSHRINHAPSTLNSRNTGTGSAAAPHPAWQQAALGLELWKQLSRHLPVNPSEIADSPEASVLDGTVLHHECTRACNIPKWWCVCIVEERTCTLQLRHVGSARRPHLQLK